MYHTVKLLSHGLAFGLIGLLLTPTLVFAEPIAWTGAAGNGSWHTPGNWDLNRLPTQADDVTIALDGTYTVNVDSDVVARTLVLGGLSGTQTLAINSNRMDLRISGTVLSNGVLQLTNNGVQLWILTADNTTHGTLVNTGTIRAGADGSPGGRRRLFCHLNNQGSVIAYNAELTMGANPCNVINSGTITALGGDFSSTFDGEFRNRMNVTNTGTIAISPGRTFRTLGTLTLQGGTFGGTAANLHLRGATVNLGAGDFHTADWASLDVGYSTFNGPGRVINDRPAGFDPVGIIFNALVDNLTVLSTSAQSYGYFNSGLLNQVGATLRVLGDNNSTVTYVMGGFTNNGTVHIISAGSALRVDGGPLVNNGLIEARREGNPQGTRSIYASINNHGTITNVDVSDLRIGGGNETLTLNNFGTINIQSGVLSNHDGVNSGNNLTFNNNGMVNFAPGTLYRQRGGTLNLISGTFGGPGSNLNLMNSTVSHTADFHTADWASIYDIEAMFNGPGVFVNDHPMGFTAVGSIFNTFVRNVTSFTSLAAQFRNGYVNQLGSTLRTRYTVEYLSSAITVFYASFTNDGVIEVIDPGAAILIQGPSPDFVPGTLFNSPAGQIHVRHLETPAAGLRFLSCNIANHGRITVHDVDLQVGYGNLNTRIENTGTFELLGGDLVFTDAPFNKGWIRNFGTFDLGVNHTVNMAQEYYTNIPPFVFENKQGAILSGSGTIYCATGGPTPDNRIELGGIVRPGGHNAVGTLNLLGTVTVPGSAFQIGLTVEVDVGGPGPQANDQLNAALLPPQGGRYLRVNVLGSNLPPAGTSFEVGASPYIASNLPVGNGSVCVGCYSGEGPDGACSGLLTVLSDGCPWPGISQNPSDAAACSGDAQFSIVAAGESPLSYQWRKDSVPLTDGTTLNGSVLSGALTGTLSITGATEGDEGFYDCVVTNAYGTATSSTAELSVCAGDFNCDGFLDFFDYDAFVECYETEVCGGGSADFNGDGFVDFFDYDDYVLAFEVGC